MAKGDTAVLDFGSGKISAMIGERGVNGCLNVLGSGEAQYGGFMDGDWLEPEKVASAVGYAINNAQTNSRTRVKKLFVGMPGEFTTASVKDVNINFAKKRRVTDFDIDELFEIGHKPFENRMDYEVVNQGAIYFQTDDNRRIVNPEGLSTTKLSGRISYVLGETRFINFVRKLLSEMGITDVEFVSSAAAEILYLFEPRQRDQYVLMLDAGYITSSVVLGRGDGIINMQSFSLGGGHITADLSEVLEINFSEAESLKRKVVLSLSPSEKDVYEILAGSKEKQFPAQQVNEIVQARLEMIAGVIKKCLDMKEEYPAYIPLHLTGGGIAYIKGAREFISKAIGKPVEVVASKQPQLNRPHMSSVLGLLDMAVNYGGGEPEKKKGFFAGLFKK